MNAEFSCSVCAQTGWESRCKLCGQQCATHPCWQTSDTPSPTPGTGGTESSAHDRLLNWGFESAANSLAMGGWGDIEVLRMLLNDDIALLKALNLTR